MTDDARDSQKEERTGGFDHPWVEYSVLKDRFAGVARTLLLYHKAGAAEARETLK